MKKASLILALVFVSSILFPACDNQLEEIEVKKPTSKKLTDDEEEHSSDPFGN